MSGDAADPADLGASVVRKSVAEALALAAVHPPHRESEAWLEALRPAPTRAPVSVRAVFTGAGELKDRVGAERLLVRATQTMTAAELRAYIGEVTAGRVPGWQRVVTVLQAMVELAALREAGTLSPDAARRLVFLIDAARPQLYDVADLPGDGVAGLRAKAGVLEAAAPTWWRLAGRGVLSDLERMEVP